MMRPKRALLKVLFRVMVSSIRSYVLAPRINLLAEQAPSLLDLFRSFNISLMVVVGDDTCIEALALVSYQQ